MWNIIKKITRLMNSKNRNVEEESSDDGSEIKGSFKSSKVKERLEEIRKVMGNSLDIITREIKVGDEPGIPAAVIYLDGLIDKVTVFQHVIKPLTFEAQSIKTGETLSTHQVFIKLIESRLSAGEVMLKESCKDFFNHLVSGDTLILLEDHSSFIIVSTRGWEGRTVEEPENEAVIRGPREGFTETLKTNLSLLRRRLKTPHLHFDSYYIGRLSQTTVIVAYLNNIVNPKLVEEVKKRLERIDIDTIESIGYIEELIEDNPFSPFPQMKITERPDVVAAQLAEGRAAVMIENSPNVITLPTTFFEMLQGADDYYQRYWYFMFMIRVLRFLAVNISLVLPAFYVAVTTFHHELIPTALLINIAASREGVPFPAVVEALLMEGTFELLREAGLRLPNIIGPAVTIVGALVLGEAAFRAGIVSPAMVIVVALTAIANFSIPSFSAAIPLRLLRFAMVLLGAFLGLYGIIFGLLGILIHLSALRSFGVPYITPIAPLVFRDLKDSVIRPPTWARGKRPSYLQTQDRIRQKDGLKPRPPQRD